MKINLYTRMCTCIQDQYLTWECCLNNSNLELRDVWKIHSQWTNHMILPPHISYPSIPTSCNLRYYLVFPFQGSNILFCPVTNTCICLLLRYIYSGVLYLQNPYLDTQYPYKIFFNYYYYFYFPSVSFYQYTLATGPYACVCVCVCVCGGGGGGGGRGVVPFQASSGKFLLDHALFFTPNSLYTPKFRPPPPHPRPTQIGIFLSFAPPFRNSSNFAPSFSKICVCYFPT